MCVCVQLRKCTKRISNSDDNGRGIYACVYMYMYYSNSPRGLRQIVKLNPRDFRFVFFVSRISICGPSSFDSILLYVVPKNINNNAGPYGLLRVYARNSLLLPDRDEMMTNVHNQSAR